MSGEDGKTPMLQRILNGFQIVVRGRFLWLNAYGFGIGRVDGWEFVRYRPTR